MPLSACRASERRRFRGTRQPRVARAAENLSGRLEQLAEWRVSSPSISYQGETTCQQNI
jgi:hypothetical protein